MSNPIQASTVIPEYIDVSAAESKHRIQIAVAIPQIIKLIAVIVTTLIITGTLAGVITHHIAPSPDHPISRLMHRFDLGFEPSIPNWYSSVALLASAVLLALISCAKWQQGDRFTKHWIGLSTLFLCLAVDEGVRFHEMIHTVIASRVDVHGIFYFPWVVPAFVFAGVVGLIYLTFLINLERRTAILFVVAGATYVFGAVGMDMVSGVLVEQHGMESVHHTISQTFEELFEMSGVAIFLYALLNYIRLSISSVQIRLV